MTKKEIGAKLKAKKEKLGLTNYDLMTQNGLSYPSTKAIESGTKSYTIDSFLSYLEAVGMELKDL